MTVFIVPCVHVTLNIGCRVRRSSLNQISSEMPLVFRSKRHASCYEIQNSETRSRVLLWKPTLQKLIVCCVNDMRGKQFEQGHRAGGKVDDN